jgi:8-oxo-dGTP pyrophosphatase MutT (NUDIX family)
MKDEGTLPAAIAMGKAETIIVTGAVMAGLPLVDSLDVDLLRDDDQVSVDGTDGTVDLPQVQSSRVVTCVLRNGDSILMLKRSDKVGTNQGLWAGVSGYIETGEQPIDTAYKEIREEVKVEAPRFVRGAPPIMVRAKDRIWEVNPFLFDVPDRSVTIDWEHTEYRWMTPAEVSALETVPGFDRVLRALL